MKGMEELIIFPNVVLEITGPIPSFRIKRYNVVEGDWRLLPNEFTTREEAQNFADELNRESGPVTITLGV